MKAPDSNANRSLKSSFLIPAFVLCAFLGSTGFVILSTLLVDVASALDVPLGTAGQLATIVGASSVVLGFVMSALTIRFPHKSLFLTGITLHSIGALGLFLASDFISVAFFWLLMGTGAVMMTIMIYALIGSLLPLEKRGWAIGLIVSMSSFGIIFDSPLYGFMNSIAGWRSIPLLFIFPISIACLSISYLVVPSKSEHERPPPSSEYTRAFKQIFSNRSTVACLVGTGFLYILSANTLYGVSFYRLQFSVLPIVGGIFAATAAVSGMVGGVGGGRLINRAGRKTLTILSSFTAGVFVIFFTFMPNIWVSLVFFAASTLAFSMAMASLNSLVLEQVPEFKASMMSMNTTFAGIFGITGNIISGLLLNLYTNNFHILMPFLGSTGIALAAVVFLFAKDPYKNHVPSQSKP